ERPTARPSWTSRRKTATLSPPRTADAGSGFGRMVRLRRCQTSETEPFVALRGDAALLQRVLDDRQPLHAGQLRDVRVDVAHDLATVGAGEQMIHDVCDFGVILNSGAHGAPELRQREPRDLLRLLRGDEPFACL